MTRLDKPRIGRWTGATLCAGLALLAIAAVAPVSANAAACTKTMTGVNSGVINVPGGQKLCLTKLTQDGAVNVAPGGGLSVTDSKITGAVTLKSGFGEFGFCRSTTVRGAISATGGKGTVVIGGTGCASTIDGAVTLDSNKKGVTLAGNGIAGAVTANANLGGTTISANRIGGALTCTANIPAPVNGGMSNTVGGGRSGQTCASLTF